MGANVSSHEIYSPYGPPRHAQNAISVISAPPRQAQTSRSVVSGQPRQAQTAKSVVSGPARQAQTSMSVISQPKKGQVISFQSSAKWRNYFQTTKQTSKLVVVDFTASWCKPCQIIQPAFNAFAEKYTDVEFVKIDVDQLVDVAAGFGVHVMPTFILLKRGKEVDKVVGVKKDELQKKIEKYRF